MELEKVDTYRVALKEARASFDQATHRLGAISLEAIVLNSKLRKLRRTITALAAMCSESPGMDELGITDSCWEVMEAERQEVSTLRVVQKLEGMGFDLSSQKNPAASVHAVLSRLADKGKIKKVTTSDGSIAWQGPNYDESSQISDDDIPF
jgi:hypothetical protein